MTSKWLSVGKELKAYRDSIKRLRRYYRRESFDPFCKMIDTYTFCLVLILIFIQKNETRNDTRNYCKCVKIYY